MLAALWREFWLLRASSHLRRCQRAIHWSGDRRVIEASDVPILKTGEAMAGPEQAAMFARLIKLRESKSRA